MGAWEGYRRVPITCAQRNGLVAALGGLETLSVHSTFTDVDKGHFFTEWGPADANVPLFGDDVWRASADPLDPLTRYPNGHCEHWRYEPDPDYVPETDGAS